MRISGDEVLILTFDEVRILLYSLGYTSCKGIYMPEKEYSAKEVILAMHKMARRGFFSEDPEGGRVRCEKQQYVLRPGLRRMMMAMGDPSGSFVFRPGESGPGFSEELYNGPEYYCYMRPDYCLVAERDWKQRDCLRLREMEKSEFMSWQKEREQEAREIQLAEGLPRERNDFAKTIGPERAAATTEALAAIL